MRSTTEPDDDPQSEKRAPKRASKRAPKPAAKRAPTSAPKRAPNTSPETAERILTAAVGEFAAHGFTKTTVRSIAAAAGVSPGLVIHHFGSKEKLREACDDHVFEVITEKKKENAAYRVMAVQMMFDDPLMTTALDYLLKSLLEPSAHGQRYFDHYVELVESYLVEGFAGYEFRRSDDVRGQAAMIAVMALAPAMLAGRLQASLGTDDLASTMTRLSPHFLDLYAHGVLVSPPDDLPTPASAGPTSAAPTDEADAAGPSPTSAPTDPTAEADPGHDSSPPGPPE